MKVAIAQLNPVVGDIENNLRRMRLAVEAMPPGEAELIVFPELYLCGYPPRDLLTLPWFLDQLDRAAEEVRALSSSRPDLGILFGTARRNGSRAGMGLANAALLFSGGELVAERFKRLLPVYDVFDERRYFDPGESVEVVEFAGEKLGISICEDAWSDPGFETQLLYDENPIETLARAGSTLLINLSASPFHRRKEENRYGRYAHHARRWGLPLVFAAQVGANDELIFDGRSMALDARGRLIAGLNAFEEEVRVVDTAAPGTLDHFPRSPEIESIHKALVLGVRDYMRKCGFSHVVLGLSGGIDSAVVACIAAEALGAENVRAVTMPSRYSSPGSVTDSKLLAERLGIRLDEIPIGPVFDRFREVLAEPFAGREEDITEENLQARIRGTLLMAYANKFGCLVLSTGNKSELAVGYCTLYGDMDGGLAVISDLPKLTVYELARWYNREHELIPEAILTKAPSAELAPDQVDSDSLPPYEVLDPILEAYLERLLSVEEIVEEGYDEATVRRVVRMVDRNEYKRRQAPPGLKVSPKAFGVGRRMPIAARIRH